MKISACIITKNEERNIERCLSSLFWVDEIVVVDSGSTDKTLEICEKHKCKIIASEWLGFGPTKNLAVSIAKNNWILSIDSDEEISPLLMKRIQSLDTTKYNGFLIKRSSYFLGKKIKFSGWQNDYPIRFFNKKYGNFNNETVHESVILSPFRTSKINEEILHYPYTSIFDHLVKINLYSELSASKMQKKNKKVSILFAILSGLIKFIKMYFIKLGFLDGKEGFILSFNSSFAQTIKYLKLWSLNNKQ